HDDGHPLPSSQESKGHSKVAEFGRQRLNAYFQKVREQLGAHIFGNPARLAAERHDAGLDLAMHQQLVAAVDLLIGMHARAAEQRTGGMDLELVFEPRRAVKRDAGMAK